MVDRSQKEVPDTVHCRVCLLRDAGDIYLIEARVFSGRQRRRKQTQHTVGRECPQFCEI